MKPQHTKPANIFRSIYSSIVKKTDSMDNEMINEQLDLITNLIKEQMTTEEVKHLLKDKIIRDRKNTDIYMSPKDRSILNRKMYEIHIILRSITIGLFMLMTACVLGFIFIVFGIDFYISYTRDHDTLIKYIDFLNTIRSE